MIPFSSKLVRSIFSSATWNVPNGKVCLTFDDGPHPKATPAILDTLDSYGIKGTFFFLGRNIEEHPELAREAAARGHAVGNHGYNHSLLLFRNRRYVVNQIAVTAERIREVTGSSSSLFRPPYGFFRPTLLQSLQTTGHRLVMWDLDPQDWRPRSASDIAATIVNKVRPGSIVLLHDSSRTADKIKVVLAIALDSLLSEHEFSAIPS